VVARGKEGRKCERKTIETSLREREVGTSINYKLKCVIVYSDTAIEVCKESKVPPIFYFLISFKISSGTPESIPPSAASCKEFYLN